MLIVFAPVFGKIFDNYGQRLTVLLGATAYILGLVFLSLSTEYYQIFLSQSILSGIGVCSLFYSGMNAVGTYLRNAELWLLASSPAALLWEVSSSRISTFRSANTHIPHSYRPPQMVHSNAPRIMFNKLVANRLSFGRAIRSLTPVYPKFLLLALAAFFVFWGVFNPLNYIILYDESLGMSASLNAGLRGGGWGGWVGVLFGS
ncbi:hypothetical protein BDW74DRAFT_181775 [Aspergillus multicolor]|uniref:uncharacterized protein n=1 Tax=Aspergillus multicolor TaxID=41759 RepID=UPI003CCD823D